MKLKRTLRERKFIKAYIENNGNATKAFLFINPEAKDPREYGYRMLQKVDISVAELLNEMCMTDSYLHQKLNEGLEATKELVNIGNVEDYPTRQKYLDMAYKLKDKYPTEKKNIDLNVQGSLEVNSELDKKLAQLDIKDLIKLSKLNADK